MSLITIFILPGVVECVRLATGLFYHSRYCNVSG
jgi:hypothetical protein